MKSWSRDMGLAQVTPFGDCCFFFNTVLGYPSGPCEFNRPEADKQEKNEQKFTNMCKAHYVWDHPAVDKPKGCLELGFIDHLRLK